MRFRHPRAFAKARERGLEEELRFATGQSTLGAVLVASSEAGVVSIQVGEDPDRLLAELAERYPDAHLVRGGPEDAKWAASVVARLESPARGLELPLDLRGTAFQKRVWRAVQQIPVGQTSTYTKIAAKIGAPKAIRAVGNACAQSPLALVIPCHRVLRSDGTWRGGCYWNAGRHAEIMAREAAALASKRALRNPHGRRNAANALSRSER